VTPVAGVRPKSARLQARFSRATVVNIFDPLEGCARSAGLCPDHLLTRPLAQAKFMENDMGRAFEEANARIRRERSENPTAYGILRRHVRTPRAGAAVQNGQG